MERANRSTFLLRRYFDDGTDSVCIECFRLVVTATDEAELTMAEQAHVCNGFQALPNLMPEQA